MTEAPIRVLVVDDQAIVRKGIRALIEQVEGKRGMGRRLSRKRRPCAQT
jgi:DNA-binding NarL/FixJ family response regulator